MLQLPLTTFLLSNNDGPRLQRYIFYDLCEQLASGCENITATSKTIRLMHGLKVSFAEQIIEQ